MKRVKASTTIELTFWWEINAINKHFVCQSMVGAVEKKQGRGMESASMLCVGVLLFYIG